MLAGCMNQHEASVKQKIGYHDAYRMHPSNNSLFSTQLMLKVQAPRIRLHTGAKPQSKDANCLSTKFLVTGDACPQAHTLRIHDCRVHPVLFVNNKGSRPHRGESALSLADIDRRVHVTLVCRFL